MRAIADPARLDRMFFALADVHRRGMLDRLSRGPASVSVLAEPLGIALPSAVKHLAVLEEGGFVASQKVGRVRTYTVEPKALDALEAWVAGRKALLNAQFDRHDAQAGRPVSVAQDACGACVGSAVVAGLRAARMEAAAQRHLT